MIKRGSMKLSEVLTLCTEGIQLKEDNTMYLYIYNDGDMKIGYKPRYYKEGDTVFVFVSDVVNVKFLDYYLYLNDVLDEYDDHNNLSLSDIYNIEIPTLPDLETQNYTIDYIVNIYFNNLSNERTYYEDYNKTMNKINLILNDKINLILNSEETLIFTNTQLYEIIDHNLFLSNVPFYTLRKDVENLDTLVNIIRPDIITWEYIYCYLTKIRKSIFHIEDFEIKVPTLDKQDIIIKEFKRVYKICCSIEAMRIKQGELLREFINSLLG